MLLTLKTSLGSGAERKMWVTAVDVRLNKSSVWNFGLLRSVVPVFHELWLAGK